MILGMEAAGTTWAKAARRVRCIPQQKSFAAQHFGMYRKSRSRVEWLCRPNT